MSTTNLQLVPDGVGAPPAARSTAPAAVPRLRTRPVLLTWTIDSHCRRWRDLIGWSTANR
jgi:hypothetical protein